MTFLGVPNVPDILVVVVVVWGAVRVGVNLERELFSLLLLTGVLYLNFD